LLKTQRQGDDFMPNWCSTQYIFYTKKKDKSELKRLHKNLADILKEPSKLENDFEPGCLGKVAIAHGFNHEEVPCRGWFDPLDEYDYEGEGDFFKLYTTTAWIPMDELWEAVIEQYSGVSYVYMSEESGMELYINTDIEGKYFGDRYLLEIYGDKVMPEGWCPEHEKFQGVDIREYFESLETLLDFCEKVMGKMFENIEELQDYLSKTVEGVNMSYANVYEFNAE
jgi:hypothetical protein